MLATASFALTSSEVMVRPGRLKARSARYVLASGSNSTARRAVITVFGTFNLLSIGPAETRCKEEVLLANVVDCTTRSPRPFPFHPPHGVLHELGAAFEVQFGFDAGAVALHGLDGEVHPIRDLACREAAPGHFENL